MNRLPRLTARLAARNAPLFAALGLLLAAGCATAPADKFLPFDATWSDWNYVLAHYAKPGGEAGEAV
ncbi:MAG: hypothetical protein M1457_05150, partial [bacterium]|nr:hypothetical protein [bacterium]